MKKIIAIVLLAIMMLPFFAVSVRAEESEVPFDEGEKYLITVKGNLDPEIIGNDCSVHLIFMNTETKINYPTVLSSQRSYYGEIQLPKGEYRIISVKVSGFTFNPFECPYDDRWNVEGINTTFEVTVGDPNREWSPTTAKEPDDYSNVPGMIDFEKEVGKTREELIAQLEQGRKDAQEEAAKKETEEELKPSDLVNGILITLKGDVSSDEVRFCFINEETGHRQMTSFKKTKGYELLTALPRGSYKIMFNYSKDGEKYETTENIYEINSDEFSFEIRRVIATVTEEAESMSSADTENTYEENEKKEEKKGSVLPVVFAVIIVAAVVVVIIIRKKRKEEY